jgi:hypothetical protein
MTGRLTATPPQFVLSRLDRELYVAFLEQARRQLAFVRFADFLGEGPPAAGRYVALRHDIDFAPEHSVAMAELEHDAGVASTYFVLADGQFYNPLDPAVIRQLRRIVELGHEIGLHFAVAHALHEDLGQEVAFRLALLSEIVGAPVRSYSQHDPVNAGFASIELPPGRVPCVDAYEVVRRHDLLYVSDSAMMWREHTFETALATDRNLCLVAHPHSWLGGEHDYIAMIRRFEAREVERVSAPFDAFVAALPGYYERRAGAGS